MKRLLFVVALGAGFALGGLVGMGSAQASPATGSVADWVATHQAGIQAEVNCALQPGACAPVAVAPAPAPVTQAAPAPAPPANVPSQGKAIEISISEQKLRAWEDGNLVMETPVSTGRAGHETPRGEFEILSKTPNHWSTQYHVDMPYAMRVVNGIFIHEVPIAPDGRRLGVDDLGSPVSAGCIRVGIGAAEQLYRWADVGTPVIIH